VYRIVFHRLSRRGFTVKMNTGHRKPERDTSTDRLPTVAARGTSLNDQGQWRLRLRPLK